MTFLRQNDLLQKSLSSTEAGCVLHSDVLGKTVVHLGFRLNYTQTSRNCKTEERQGSVSVSRPIFECIFQVLDGM